MGHALAHPMRSRTWKVCGKFGPAASVGTAAAVALWASTAPKARATPAAAAAAVRVVVEDILWLLKFGVLVFSDDY
jgi:ApbE superfamily uncharacterized protein (UPF0280 family)